MENLALSKFHTKNTEASVRGKPQASICQHTRMYKVKEMNKDLHLHIYKDFLRDLL